MPFFQIPFVYDTYSNVTGSFVFFYIWYTNKYTSEDTQEMLQSRSIASPKHQKKMILRTYPASILYKSIAGRYRPAIDL